MNSNRIKQLFVNIFKPSNPNLGRWFIEKDVKKVHIKIDQSNEDHCGCCSIKHQNPEKPKIDYYLPFVI